MKEWESFYVIVGAAGSTLIGIQFIVITLLATVRSRHTSSDSLSAFATPTVVHFAVALVIAAIMAAPWPNAIGAAISVAACGAWGFGYSATVVRRARQQSTYEPSRSDWRWYVLIPATVYAVLFVAGLLIARAGAAAFVVGAAVITLLLVGIHNAWDTVTFLILRAVRDHTHTSTAEKHEP